MAHFPLEKLLTEVNKVAMAPSAETLRESVTENLKYVYRRVGATSLFHPGIQIILPTPFAYADLPKTLIRLIDVRTGNAATDVRGMAGSVNRFGMIVTGEPFTGYEEAEGRFYFREGRLGVPLTATYWELPTDRTGAPTVDDRIWKAAVLYCQAEVARVDLHFRNKQSYSVAPYQVDSQAAKTEMDAARADCHEPTASDFVGLYNALHPTSYSQAITGDWR